MIQPPTPGHKHTSMAPFITAMDVVLGMNSVVKITN